MQEDNALVSNAGEFSSISNVDIKDTKALQNAINKVIKSYGASINKLDEIFIQPMLTDIDMAGVVFSGDIDTASPYYIVNYDESGSTDSITRGISNDVKSFICFKENHYIKNDLLKKVIQSAKECEYIFENNLLDIEFAFSDNELYILQVRTIIMHNKDNLSSIDLSSDFLLKLQNKIENLNASNPSLLGNKSIFGIMSDWNPAEIIGVRPKKLALSLYQELITNDVWAYQRYNYGYRNLISHPLLVSFVGVPFIDIRISFNSFIPNSLDEKIADKLVNYYLDKLSKYKNHHDKIEFKIIFSCYYFGIENELLELKSKGFTDYELNEIRISLLNLTNAIINTDNGLYKQDLEKVKILTSKYDDIIVSNSSLVDKIHFLIKEIKEYGTLPFAGVARSGFIAIQILRSFISQKIFTKEDYNNFLNSLNTISKQLSNDIDRISKKDFLDIYGHLRPSTYDILSSRYDESYDLYFSNSIHIESIYIDEFEFSDNQISKINSLISDNGLNISFNNLIIFIKESIEGRELAKFIFTKSLSKILEYINELGNQSDISKEDLAYLDIQEIIKLDSCFDSNQIQDILKTNIEKNKTSYQFTKAIKLPNLIFEPNDIYSFFLEDNEANFVTLKK